MKMENFQLPRQDLSVAYCKHLLNSVERKVFEEFINARNEIALDIGFVCPNIHMQMVGTSFISFTINKSFISNFLRSFLMQSN